LKAKLAIQQEQSARMQQQLGACFKSEHRVSKLIADVMEDKDVAKVTQAWKEEREPAWAMQRMAMRECTQAALAAASQSQQSPS